MDASAYAERRSTLSGTTVWTREIPAGGPPSRILPDGCLDLIWADDGLIVAGPDTTARLVSPRGGPIAGLRFAPGVGPALLGVPASELVDAQPELAALWGQRRAEALLRRVRAAARGDGDRGRALEAAFGEGTTGRPTPETSLATAIAVRLAGGQRVAAVAADVGLSARQLQRRSLAAFGYGPKRLARVLRLQRALGAARAGDSLACVAVACGYVDQAHLAREVRSLAGVPLTALLG